MTEQGAGDHVSLAGQTRFVRRWLGHRLELDHEIAISIKPHRLYVSITANGTRVTESIDSTNPAVITFLYALEALLLRTAYVNRKITSRFKPPKRRPRIAKMPADKMWCPRCAGDPEGDPLCPVCDGERVVRRDYDA